MKTDIHKLDSTYVLRVPIIKSAIQALQFAPKSHGLDIGCGMGKITGLLAESTAPGGHVTGVDISSELIDYAKDNAEKAGLNKVLSFRLGDMNDLPFADDTFDWVWSMDCVGYAPIEPLPLIKELVRVTKPGGSIALLAWSTQQLLPGHPELEAKLNATSAGIAPFSLEKKPAAHFLRALSWYMQLDLEALNAQTFVRTFHAPLGVEIHGALKSLLEMRWPGVRQELSNDDWLDFQRLCRPDSPDFILSAPEYYGFFTYSLFQAKVPI